MSTVDADGVSIGYEEHGPPAAETVVFVEGLAYGRWMWRWQADALAEDYHVVRYDNRGTGESDAPDGPYTIPEMAGDLDAVLAEVLDSGEDAHIVGASMGGMIAMQYALQHDRASSLVLLCTSHGGEDAVPIPDETLDRMFDLPDDASPGGAIRYKMRPAMTDAFWEEHQELIEQIVDWRLESDASGDAREAQAEGVQAFDVQDRLGAVDVPTLVLHGTVDRVLPVENGRMVADGIPDAEFVPIEDGSHLFFIEAHETVTDYIHSFFDGA